MEDQHEKIHLACSLGTTQADTAVRDIIRRYEQLFPQHIAGYYIEGSYADQMQLATSDLDLVLVLRQPFEREDERKLAEQAWMQCESVGSLEIDITMKDEQQLHNGVHPTLKLGSRFLYGEDVCRKYPLIPIEIWTRERMHAAYWLTVSIYQRSTPVNLQLDFPAPTDEFYGYINRTVCLADGREVPCTRNLVRTTGWCATALLALQAGQYIGRKRDCARLYREHIGDEWASLQEEIATFCRDTWQYLIPAEPQARQHLCTICEQTLLFERHFLTCYKAYLSEQLRSPEQEAIRFALWVQSQLPLDDEEIMATIRAMPQPDVR